MNPKFAMIENALRENGGLILQYFAHFPGSELPKESSIVLSFYFVSFFGVFCQSFFSVGSKSKQFTFSLLVIKETPVISTSKNVLVCPFLFISVLSH